LVYFITKFVQEPDKKLPIVYSLPSTNPSGVSFDEKTLKVTVDSDLPDKGEKSVDIEIHGELQNVTGTG
jgi:hypothetical protein